MENKEKIISELYTIKAGLSVISQEADKIKHFQTVIDEGQEEIKNRELILESGDSGLPYFQKQRKSREGDSAMLLRIPFLGIVFFEAAGFPVLIPEVRDPKLTPLPNAA